MQIVGIGTSQSAAAAVLSLVGGPAATASPGPPDAITSALAGMTRKQLYDIMAQMKGLIVQNPGQVTSCRDRGSALNLEWAPRLLSVLLHRSIQWCIRMSLMIPVLI